MLTENEIEEMVAELTTVKSELGTSDETIELLREKLNDYAREAHLTIFELLQARARLKWALVPGNGVAKSDGSFMFNTRTVTMETIAAMRILYGSSDEAIDAAIESVG